jgi:hypothetical protein
MDCYRQYPVHCVPRGQLFVGEPQSAYIEFKTWIPAPCGTASVQSISGGLLVQQLGQMYPVLVLYLSQFIICARTLEVRVMSQTAHAVRTVILNRVISGLMAGALPYCRYPGGQLFPLLPGK